MTFIHGCVRSNVHYQMTVDGEATVENLALHRWKQHGHSQDGAKKKGKLKADRLLTEVETRVSHLVLLLLKTAFTSLLHAH